MYKKKSCHVNAGFTLIELLIVIAVMAILTTVVFVALNPLARFQDARNNRRNTDVMAIISALKLHQVDNGGMYYGDIEDLDAEVAYMIGGCVNNAAGIVCNYPDVSLAAKCIDLASYVDGGYLPSIPTDPNSSTNNSGPEHTGYYLIKHASGSIEIGSCFEEPGTAGTPQPISVRR